MPYYRRHENTAGKAVGFLSVSAASAVLTYLIGDYMLDAVLYNESNSILPVNEFVKEVSSLALTAGSATVTALTGYHGMKNIGLTIKKGFDKLQAKDLDAIVNVYEYCTPSM